MTFRRCFPLSCLALAALAAAQDENPHLDRFAAPRTALPDLGPLPPLVVDAVSTFETWAVGRGYKAGITADGLRFHALPGPELPLQPVALALQQVRVGEVVLPLRTAKLPDDGPRCVLDHGSLREHLDLRPEGVEQSFHFAALPTRGELVVRVAVTTSLGAMPRDGGVRFGDGPQAVHYGSATVFDAAGRKLSLPSEWRDGGIQITVPAPFVREATLPLVVDPLLSSPATWVLGTGTGSNLAVAGPDLAFSPVTNSWLLVWRMQVASNDHDAYARRFDASWNPLGSAQGVDLTTWNWSQPRVAHLRIGDEWRIAAYREQPFSPTFDVVVRRWSAGGAVGAVLLVDTVTGSSLPAFGPVIGGDPYDGSGLSNVLVAWPASAEVRYATVDQVGNVAPVATLGGTATISDLSLSKGNGTNRWLLAYAEWHSPVLQPSVRYQGAFIDYTGVVVPTTSGATLALGSMSSLSWVPSGMIATSAPDVLGDFTIVLDVSQIGSLQVRKVRNSGAMTALVSLDSVAPGWGRVRTTLETDGVRTLVTKAQGNDVRGTLLACDATVGTWRADDDFVIAGTLPVTRVAPASRSVFLPDDRVTAFTLGYGMASSTISAVRIVDYGGYSPGAGFSTVPVACGQPLSIAHGSTLPALGNTVRFTLGTSFPLAGFVVGAPAAIPLSGICNCTLGVNGLLVVGNQIDVPIPANIVLVGQAFATQGFSFQGGPCLGTVSLSQAIVTTIL